MKHLSQTDLALAASGDLTLARNWAARWHAARCESCKATLEAFRADRRGLRASSDAMPDEVDWERLSSEMTANIRLGLEAGECVGGSSGERRRPLFGAWKPAAAVAGVVVLLAGAWWLNVPAADTQSLGRVFQALLRGGRDRMPQGVGGSLDRGPVVAVTAAGVEVRENGRSLGVAQSGIRPVAVSLSVEGSASAHYVDADTGQVTITSVYVE